MKSVSNNIKAQTHSLSPKAYINFLKLEIPTETGTSVFYLTDGVTQTWNNETWVNTPFYLSGVGSFGSGEKARPKLALPNDEGTFTYFVHEKFIENSVVTRYQVHPDDLQTLECITSVYYVAQVTGLNKYLINLTLRSPSDGNNFKLPSRRFSQPEFPTVSL